MFKRHSAKKNEPLKSIMVQVQGFTNLAGDESKPKDAVIGRRFDNGEQVIIQLTNSGEAADNRKRNSIDSFTKKSSKHHVEIGGLMQFDTVWFNGEEINGAKSGIARWASFFERNEAGIEQNVSKGKIMLHVGSSVREGEQEYRYGYVDRLGKPMPVEREKLESLLERLLAKCNEEGAAARPTLRVIDGEGRVVEYCQATQRDVKDAESGAYRRQTLPEMMEDMKKSFGFKLVEKALEDGKGTLELIPTRSFKISPKTMNESTRGKAFMGLGKVFSDDSQSYALEAWVRTVTSEETGAKFISNIGLVDHQRIEPLLLASDAHPTVTYHQDLLDSLSNEKGAERSAEDPTPTPDDMQQPGPDIDDHGPDEAYHDVPGFN